jgi:hypothetical protein
MNTDISGWEFRLCPGAWAVDRRKIQKVKFAKFEISKIEKRKGGGLFPIDKLYTRQCISPHDVAPERAAVATKKLRAVHGKPSA